LFAPAPSKRQRTGSGPSSGDEGDRGYDDGGAVGDDDFAIDSPPPEADVFGPHPSAPGGLGEPGFDYTAEAILLPDYTKISGAMGSEESMELYAWAQSSGTSDTNFTSLLVLLKHIQCPGISAACAPTLHNRFRTAFPNAMPEAHDCSLPPDLGQRVIFHHINVYHAIVDMLQDADNQAHEGLHLGPIHVVNKRGVPMLGETVNGGFFRGLPVHRDPNGDPHVNIVINLSSDGTPLNSGKLGTHPMYVQLANLGNVIKQAQVSLRYVASIPQIQYQAGDYHSKEQFARRQRLLLQQCHAFIIKSVMAANRAQPRIQLYCGRFIIISIFFNAQVCDHLEAASLANCTFCDNVK
jgi:hypothetical protein